MSNRGDMLDLFLKLKLSGDVISSVTSLFGDLEDMQKEELAGIIIQLLCKCKTEEEAVTVIEDEILVLKPHIDEIASDLIMKKYYRYKSRMEVLQGLIFAFDNKMKVFECIVESESVEDVKKALGEKFNLSEEQVNVIINGRLRVFTKEEELKVRQDYLETKQRYDNHVREMLAIGKKFDENIISDIVRNKADKTK